MILALAKIRVTVPGAARRANRPVEMLALLRCGCWLALVSVAKSWSVTIDSADDLVCKGGAGFFYNLLPDGNPDEFALHAAQPVKIGEKWFANVWLWDPGYPQNINM